MKNLFNIETYRGATLSSPNADTIIAERIQGRSFKIVFHRRINSAWRVEIKATGYIMGDPDPNFAPLGSHEVTGMSGGAHLIQFWMELAAMCQTSHVEGLDQRIMTFQAMLKNVTPSETSA